MNKPKILVLICDDDGIYREGLKSVFETAPDIELVGEVDTAQLIYRRVIEFAPDLLIIDLKWYGDQTAGWSSIRDVKKARPDIKIIALTAFENLIDEARLSGADAALVKTFDKDHLLSLIRELAQREEEFAIPQRDMGIDNNISDREREVLTLISKGGNNREISEALFISEGTVKNHVKNILSKLGAKNRTQAVDIARQMKIIT